MKYPIGTKCWVANTPVGKSQYRGLIVTVISHHHPVHRYANCWSCGTNEHQASTDQFVNGEPISGCCLCTLIPIDDPDAGKAVEEELALPFDPRKVGETA